MTASDGTSAVLDVLVSDRFFPRDAVALARTDAPALVSASWLSPRTREILDDADVSYTDTTGNASLRLSEPGLFIRTEGARRDPSPEPTTGPNVRGPRAWALLRSMAEVQPPSRVSPASSTSRHGGSFSRSPPFIRTSAIVLIGAQAVYLRTTGRLPGYQPFTTDADLVVDPALLADVPLLGDTMTAAGFTYTGEPGIWEQRFMRPGFDSEVRIPVDLIVPEQVAPKAGRRGARLHGGHGNRAARKTAGVEGALVDHSAVEITSLEPGDTRSAVVNVAGSAALLVSKAFKLGERLDKPERLQPKDAGDVYRLFDATSIAAMSPRPRLPSQSTAPKGTMRNVFVIGLDPFNLDTMQRLRESRRYDFRSLLPSSKVLKAGSYDFDQLVRDADRELADFDQTVDGIVTWWDFPSSALIPVVTEMWDLYGPDLRSVLTLEHKYWSRLVQRAVASDHVPSFTAFDPFSDDALDLVLDAGLEYPFWLKPVKSVASYLGFRINGPEDFEHALGIIRAEIGQYGDPFQQALDRVDDLPPEIEWIGGNACLAEGIIGGWQCTVEGYVSRGDIRVYGTVDSIREEGVSTFRAYHYPSRLPTPIQRRMAQISADVIEASGLDHSCFNIEFYYDPDGGQLWLLEVNVRLSQSHCDLFHKVDGASSQRAMIDLAQGRAPRMPYRQGEFAVAAKYFLRTTVDDGIVRSVPSDADIATVQERFPGTRVEVAVEADARLSELPVQETYSYELGRVYFGVDTDHDQLEPTFAEIESMLPFEIDPVEAGP